MAYNNVFGYYIEVRNVHKDKVPKEWIRKQTLVNAERYITQELKEYEEKILGAEDKILILETQLYTDLVQALMEFIPQIQINANQIARLDCLLSFANVARENRYIRPIIEDNDVLDIRQGRHPVIEKQLPIGEKYIANDVMLDNTTQQIIIITGPNMAGKSALLRQTALITLLAQIGSFVPAESAHIGLVDKTEADIAELETYEDRQMFLAEVGLEESGVARLIKSAYKLLNLETYFTAGVQEVRAWTYEKGWKAPQCAGVIHTDFEKGFIRAEVIKYEDYIQYGSEAAVKEAGKLGVEGKEYIVQDGDIMHFRFNV